jgi:hypothetical protein
VAPQGHETFMAGLTVYKARPDKGYSLTECISMHATLGMCGWLGLSQLGLAPNQKHQALLGAPKIVHCGEQIPSKVVGSQFSQLLTIKDTSVFVS